MNKFYLKYLFYFIGSFIVIFNSIKLYIRKSLLANIYSFSLIVLGYLMILLGINNRYGIIATASFIFNHVVTNFLFYMIASLFIHFYRRSEVFMLNFFAKYRYIVYCLILSKIGLPIAFGFSSNWNYLQAITIEGLYFLYLPFIVEKFFMIIFLFRVNCIFTQSKKENLEFISADPTLYEGSDYMFTILILFVVLLMTSFFKVESLGFIF
jgi:formate hydrogenlyase subunit 3/multisubunit Na+/H+ antiporter MnhD subunit